MVTVRQADSVGPIEGAAGRRSAQTGFRPDIEGLRAKVAELTAERLAAGDECSRLLNAESQNNLWRWREAWIEVAFSACAENGCAVLAGD